MHPCALEEGRCCGGHNYGAAVIRFTSHFHAEGARVMLAYDVYPFCGDGLDLVVTHNFVAAYRGQAVLLQQGYGPSCSWEALIDKALMLAALTSCTRLSHVHLSMRVWTDGLPCKRCGWEGARILSSHSYLQLVHVS